MFRHLTNHLVENCKVQIYPVTELILILPIFTDKITGMKKLIVGQLHFITVKKKKKLTDHHNKDMSRNGFNNI